MIANVGNLSESEFSDLATLCSPVEKLLLRYLLTKIYGTEEAAVRFNLNQEMLKKEWLMHLTQLKPWTTLSMKNPLKPDLDISGAKPSTRHCSRNSMAGDRPGRRIK